jgi:thiamine transporter ThiT
MKEAMSAINSKERKPDVLLIAYLICLIVSAVLLFVPKSKTQNGSTLTAVLAMLLLFCFYWIYNKGWEEKMTGELSVLPMVKLSLQFGWALWVSMLLLFAFSTLGIVGFFSKRKDSALEIYTPNRSSDQDLKEDV